MVTRTIRDSRSQGLLIEPGNDNYKRLVANRPMAARLHAAVCSQKGEVHLVDTDNIGGVWEFMTPAFREMWHKDVDMSTLPTILCVPLRCAAGAGHR